ncbi:MAG: SURF1 family protein [Pelagibacteraceae bacterium TMED170]|nr:MAG: SURF1 family protein [Pelagibacteraceae bacterium TMED170]
MKKSLSFTIFVIFFITLFCSLGTWQLYRLQWKQALISEIKQGLDSTPVEYSKLISQNYQRVALKGKYFFKDQIYLYSLNEKGQPGFDVITPFETLSGENVLINRGWIKKELKNTKEINLVKNNLVLGFLKKNIKKNIFKPDNSIEENIWFSINIEDLKKSTGKDFNDFIVYLENIEVKIPAPKKISVDVPNNHLKYAITWYSISISILFYFLYFRKKQ